jgi:hypothetical protein
MVVPEHIAAGDVLDRDRGRRADPHDFSREELQSLNEELTALNSQLQETLERQRSTSNDLQNILDSSGVATLFLDTNLNIRFFTPAAKSLFRIIATDIGRPLADLARHINDSRLIADAVTVLAGQVPPNREVEGDNGAWYSRNILPYRTQDTQVAGVVITFADISERKTAERAIEAARSFEELRQTNYLLAAVPAVPQEFSGLGLTHVEVCRERRRVSAALGINMHLLTRGIAADLSRKGDNSRVWLLEEAASGAVVAYGYSESGKDLEALYSAARAERVEGGYPR